MIGYLIYEIGNPCCDREFTAFGMGPHS